MPAERPKFPLDDLRAAVGGDREAQARLDALNRELSAAKPARSTIASHVGELRKHASIGTLIANWFDDPRTQAFIDELSAGGL